MSFVLRRRKKAVHVGVSRDRSTAPGITRTNRPATAAFDARFGADLLISVPTSPGVYRFYGDDGEVIYVGKAVNLRNRLRQYRLAKRRRRDWKMRSIVHAATRLEWEVAVDALAASVKEVELIQQLRPRGNVVSAYAFMYPFVGIRATRDVFYICTTTHQEAFQGWSLHGCFRSRAATGDAFFALMRLLAYLGHPVPRSRLRPEIDVPHSRVFGFRQLPGCVTEGLDALFRGVDADCLPTLAMALLDKASARSRAADVKADLITLRNFWRDEARPLREAVATTGYEVWPVPQTERDPIFLRWRDAVPTPPAPKRTRPRRSGGLKLSRKKKGT